MRATASVVLTLAMTTASAAFAQPAKTPAPVAAPPLTATAVLANVQQHYARAGQLTARFRQVATSATFHTTTTSDGQLWVAKPSQFRWDYIQKKKGYAVVTRSFIFDGQTLWGVDHGTKQIIQSKTQNSALPAAVSFLTAGAQLSSAFTAALDTTGTYGGAGALVVARTPKQPSAHYVKRYFVVDPSDWHVAESVVVDANGDTHTFKLYTPDLTTPIPASAFLVNPASLPAYTLVVAGAQGGAGSAAPAQP